MVNLGVRGAARAEKFFGCSLDKVSRLNLLMVMDGHFPEVLRGRPRLADLPRKRNSDVDFPYVVPHPLVSQKALAYRALYVIEMFEHGWNFTERGMSFEDEMEYFLFQLANP